MHLTAGRPEVVIGLLDGPVAVDHPDLVRERVRGVPGYAAGVCARPTSEACRHGTFVAGIVSARRGSPAPAICPGCTLLVRPIFEDAAPGPARLPSATPRGLARAILECIDAGARVLNLSAGFAQPSGKGEPELEAALDHALGRGVLVVAAAGNQGLLGSSALTRHPWVVPVAAYDRERRPVSQSNLGHSIGRRGLGAPGDGVTSLGTEGTPVSFGGTSVAAPFVTGAVALLWSLFPGAPAAEVRLALTRGRASRRVTVVPPLLDAWAAYQTMRATRTEG
jgi:subtilisin family serine protease